MIELSDLRFELFTTADPPRSAEKDGLFFTERGFNEGGPRWVKNEEMVRAVDPTYVTTERTDSTPEAASTVCIYVRSHISYTYLMGLDVGDLVMDELTDSQKEVLRFVLSFSQDRGRSATGVAIAIHSGYWDSSSAYQHLQFHRKERLP